MITNNAPNAERIYGDSVLNFIAGKRSVVRNEPKNILLLVYKMQGNGKRMRTFMILG